MQFIHAAGEDTGMPNESIDMVSVCLVNHELPNDAARSMFREAHRCVLELIQSIVCMCLAGGVGESTTLL